MNDASLKRPLETRPLGTPGGPGPGVRTDDDADPELLALPAPPQGRRIATVGLMAVAVFVALTLSWMVRHDVAYFLSNAAALEVGDATSVSPGTLESNRYVHLSGNPMASQVVRYRRLLSGETFVVFPLAGQRNVFVQMSETAFATPRAEFAGRLVSFGDMGSRLDGVRGYFERELHTPVPADAFVLMVDESPTSAWWALALVVLCALFIGLDAWLLVRWFRPISDA